MKKIRLTVEERALCGSSNSKRLRKSGSIPAIIYGPSGAKKLQVLKPDFRKMMLEKGEGAALIELNFGSHSTLSMLQASQRNPRTDDYLHVDFKEIDPQQTMTANIPLRFVGEPSGVKDEGGILDISRHTVAVTCLPEHLPEFIEINIATLGLGHSIHVKDLQRHKGVEFKTSEDEVIVSCTKLEGNDEEEEAAAEEESKPADKAS